MELVSRNISLRLVYSCFTVSLVASDTGLYVCVQCDGGEREKLDDEHMAKQLYYVYCRSGNFRC